MPQSDSPDNEIGINEKLRKVAAEGLKYTKLAYERTNLEHEEFTADGRKIDSFVMYSDELGADDHQYRAVVMIDNEAKKIVIANAGTRVNPGKNDWLPNWKDLSSRASADLADDARLLAGEEPLKISQAKKVNDKIIELIGADKIKNYEIDFAGHSLGAAIANIQAAYFDVECQQRGIKPKKISSNTFDNPGAGNYVKNIYEENKLKIKVKFHTFNNRDNLINTNAPQAGKKYIIQPSDQIPLDETETGIASFAKFISHIFSTFFNGVKIGIKKFASFVCALLDVPKKFISKILKLCSMGSISTQLKGHGIGEFEKVLVNKDGSVTPLNPDTPEKRLARRKQRISMKLDDLKEPVLDKIKKIIEESQGKKAAPKKISLKKKVIIKKKIGKKSVLDGLKKDMKKLHKESQGKKAGPKKIPLKKKVTAKKTIDTDSVLDILKKEMKKRYKASKGKSVVRASHQTPQHAHNKANPHHRGV